MMKSLHCRLAFLLVVLASLIIARPQELDDAENEMGEEWLIHLEYELSTEQRFDLKKKLEDIVGYNYVETIWLAKRPEIFVVAGSDAQLGAVSKLPGVRKIVKDVPAMEIDDQPGVPINDGPNITLEQIDPDSYYNDTSVEALGDAEKQTSADLKIVSWPPMLPLPKKWSQIPYVYDSNNVSETYIYVIDRGVNTEHPDFLPRPSDTGSRVPYWIFARPNRPDRRHIKPRPPQYTDDSGHGTCVASKAMGNRFGVAKKSYLIPVKLTTRYHASDVTAALIAVLDDIQQNRPKRLGKAVVVMSIMSGFRFDYRTFIPPGHAEYEDFDRYISFIKAENVPVVTCAGNDADDSPTINSVPQLFTRTPVINVGAITLDGEKALFSQTAPKEPGYRPELYAPGARVTCAKWYTTGVSPSWGTSFAAPMVGGLISYFQGLANPPIPADAQDYERKMYDFLANTASRQIAGSTGPRVIWNLGNVAPPPVRDSTAGSYETA